MATMSLKQEMLNKCYHRSLVDFECTMWCDFACSYKVSRGLMDCCYVQEP